MALEYLTVQRASQSFWASFAVGELPCANDATALMVDRGTREALMASQKRALSSVGAEIDCSIYTQW